MSTTNDRSDLARQQTQILSALRAGTTPDGFSAPQLTHAAQSLSLKRRREAALAAPILASALADSFNTHFTAYSAAHTYPPNGPPADAAAFGRYLVELNQFPPAALPEWLHLQARSGPRLQLLAVMKSLTLTWRIRNSAWVFQIIRRPR